MTRIQETQEFLLDRPNATIQEFHARFGFEYYDELQELARRKFWNDNAGNARVFGSYEVSTFEHLTAQATSEYWDSWRISYKGTILGYVNLYQ